MIFILDWSAVNDLSTSSSISFLFLYTPSKYSNMNDMMAAHSPKASIAFHVKWINLNSSSLMLWLSCCFLSFSCTKASIMNTISGTFNLLCICFIPSSLFVILPTHLIGQFLQFRSQSIHFTFVCNGTRSRLNVPIRNGYSSNIGWCSCVCFQSSSIIIMMILYLSIVAKFFIIVCEW